MRKTIIAGVLICGLTVQAGFAGNILEPMMEPDVIVEDTSSSSGGGLLIPILLLVFLAAAASGGGGSGGSPSPSDSRLKTDITQVGMSASGLPIYHFRYIGLPTTYQGVMAQDVLAHTPEAVVNMPGGYYAVNYGMLGLEMTVVD